MVIGVKKINPLMKATLVYLISTLIGQGMSFLGIIVFTRLMSQTDYGNYSTYYAYVSIFTVLVGANLYYALNNAYIDKRDTIKEFRKSVLILSALIMLAILCVMLVIGAGVLRKTTPLVLILGILHSYSFFVVTYRTYSANMENDYKKKGWLLILPNTLQFLFSLILIIFLPLQIGFAARVIGSSVGVAMIAGIAAAEILREDGRYINLEHWKYGLSIALPTVAMSLSYMLMQQCDKVMIQSICGADDTAVYSVIYYLGYSIVAVDQAAAPVRQVWIYKRLDVSDLSETKLIQKWYLIAMFFLAMVMLLAGPEIVKLLAPESYWQFEYISPFILSACMMLFYRFYTEIILFYKKNLALSISVLICALLNIVLNYVLIPRFGAIAACYTTVVAYCALFILTWILSEKRCRGIYSMRIFLAFIIYMIGLSVLFSGMSEQFVLRMLMLILLAMAEIVYMIKRKNEWKNILWEKTV